MKRLLITAAALCLTAGPVLAQPHDDHHSNGPAMAMHGPSHSNWRAGGRIQRNDWNRGQKVDYRSRHLRTPPRGYEWRQVDNNYVLAAVATGVIASVILASH